MTEIDTYTLTNDKLEALIDDAFRVLGAVEATRYIGGDICAVGNGEAMKPLFRDALDHVVHDLAERAEKLAIAITCARFPKAPEAGAGKPG